MMKYFLVLLVVVLINACTYQPKRVADKAAVYGTVTAEAQFMVKHKWQQHQDELGYEEIDEIDHDDTHKYVDYTRLTDIYIGLVAPYAFAVKQHHIVLEGTGFKQQALALAVGDTLVVHNHSNKKQHLFISEQEGSDSKLQVFPEVNTGAVTHLVVQLAGNLELLTESDPSLQMHLFVQPKMQAQRLTSGDAYQFERLAAGRYQLVVWHWRIGAIYKDIMLSAGVNLRVDRSLSVDKVLRSQGYEYKR